jgi:hypothetical protein
VWYMVSMGLRGMYSHICQSAVVGRELLCKTYPSSLRWGCCVSSLFSVATMLIIDYGFRVRFKGFHVCEHSFTAVCHTIIYCSLSIASMFSRCITIN